MYEDQTFSVIMQRLLNRVSDDFDKREGSIIYDALAPAAVELVETYIEIDTLIKESFAGTATRTFLIRRAAEHGITPLAATKAVLKGVFKDGNGAAFNVPVGSRFNLEALNYAVTEKIIDGQFKVECETSGDIGNTKLGIITPIEYIDGLGTAELTEVLIYGEDEEATEVFRARYFLELSQLAQDGNIAQYEEWIAAFPGIGKGKVFPIWNGANTVKVSILDVNNAVATQTLIDEFQEYLDPNSAGLGNGVAPIGAIVTVTTATAVTINVAMQIELAAGFAVESGVENAVKAYFADVAYKKATVSYLALAAKILDVPCVDQIVTLTMNVATTDIALSAEEIPVLGTFSCQVVT